MSNNSTATPAAKLSGGKSKASNSSKIRWFGVQIITDAVNRIKEVTTKPEQATSNRKDDQVNEIRSKIGGFADTSEVLIKVLDEVKDLHPCIELVVIAFKAVVGLALKRQENDDRVMVLMLKMQDMMTVLLHLRSIPQAKEVDYNDQPHTVEKMIASLCDQIEKHIKGCGNLCDAYSKEGRIFKIIKSPFYEIRLAEFGDTFSDHQRELEFRLNLFITKEIRTANEGISQMQESLHSVHDKLDMLLVFQLLQPRPEKDVWQFVKAKGGLAKVMEDDQLAAQLVQVMNGDLVPQTQTSASGGNRAPQPSAAGAPVGRESRGGYQSSPGDGYANPRARTGFHYSPMHVPAMPLPGSSVAGAPMGQESQRGSQRPPDDNYANPLAYTGSHYSPMHVPAMPPPATSASPYPPTWQPPAASPHMPAPSTWSSSSPSYPPPPVTTSYTPQGVFPAQVPAYAPMSGWGGVSDVYSSAASQLTTHNGPGVDPSSTTSKDMQNQVTLLRKDMEEDPDQGVQANQDVYLRKLNAQEQKFRELSEQQKKYFERLEQVVVQQGDRSVEEANKGPHDRIYDKELRKVWQDMRWPLLVKTRHFVHTLHDYFVAQHQDMHNIDLYLKQLPAPGSAAATGTTLVTLVKEAASRQIEDKWALESLTLTNLQPICEAFDTDASGFVSVWEANRVCWLRPEDWSLLHWLAYWASGRHFAVWHYSQKIFGILQDIHRLLQTQVLPLNRYAIDRYVSGMRLLHQVLSSTHPCEDPPKGELNRRVSSYTQKEEERMNVILNALHYQIDSLDTVELVTSRYHIERDFFPLIYLLLRRHLALVRLACDVVLDPKEMTISSQSLECLFDAVLSRIDSLRMLFSQGKSNPRTELSKFSFGMYYGIYRNHNPKYELTAKMKDVDDKITPAPTDWLIAGVPEVEPEPVTDTLDFESYIGNGMNGCWNGNFVDADGKEVLRSVQFCVSNWNEDIGSFEGTGMYPKGIILIRGSYDSTTNTMEATFSISEIGKSGEDFDIHIASKLKSRDKRYTTISAKWGYSEDRLTGRVSFSRWIHLLRESLDKKYPPTDYHRPGDVVDWHWRFALTAVRHYVRLTGAGFDQGFLRQRFKQIRRAVVLFKQQLFVGPLSSRGIGEMVRIQRESLIPSTIRICVWLARTSHWPTVH
uniref:Uncharacterized protein n=1 Tax=Moniliophthora roreri TaxID=221103 RepID=A0A0W0FDP9_MONRR